MALNPNLLKNIRQVVPYVAGEQPQEKVMKLNTNENPYPPAPGVQKVLKEMDAGRFCLYPDPESVQLTKVLADYHGIEEEQVFVGVGSDDVLAMCFMTFFNSKKPILFPDITYSFYKVWAELFGVAYVSPTLDDDFKIKREDYYHSNGGIIFPNPNAPTGIYEDLDFVRDILDRNPDVIVIVDEAYIDFAGISAVELIRQYDNLIVVQTFSKSRSMAGMRIGYAMANATLIAYLNDVKHSFNSYTMNVTSQVCAVAAVQDELYFRETINKVVETREWFQKELKKLGFEMTESKANFVFVTHPHDSAASIFQALKKEKIFVRHWSADRICAYLRISIGTREEMEVLLQTLEAQYGQS
ncbi:MAG: histidinol-phosphate transaminase [Lachnospiraceae bacterium]|nr:histidinol-phosphate transaminase [Lachnospiraceae bacterium]